MLREAILTLEPILNHRALILSLPVLAVLRIHGRGKLRGPFNPTNPHMVFSASETSIPHPMMTWHWWATCIIPRLPLVLAAMCIDIHTIVFLTAFWQIVTILIPIFMIIGILIWIGIKRLVLIVLVGMGMLSLLTVYGEHLLIAFAMDVYDVDEGLEDWI